MIQESARCCNHDMRLLPQSDGLLHIVHASDNKSTSKGDQGSQGLKGLRDLNGEFSRRRENETEQGLWFLEKLLQDGQGECDSLS